MSRRRRNGEPKALVGAFMRELSHTPLRPRRMPSAGAILLKARLRGIDPRARRAMLPVRLVEAVAAVLALVAVAGVIGSAGFVLLQRAGVDTGPAVGQAVERVTEQGASGGTLLLVGALFTIIAGAFLNLYRDA